MSVRLYVMTYIYTIKSEHWSWKQEIKLKWKQFCEKNYVMKYLIVNKNYHKSKFQFHTFHGPYEFNFLEVYIYLHKAIFDWNTDT